MTVALAGPNVLPVGILPLIEVPVLRWIGRIVRIFVLGSTCLEFERLDCLLVAPLPDGCDAFFGVYDIELPLLLVGGRATTLPEGIVCALSFGVNDIELPLLLKLLLFGA